MRLLTAFARLAILICVWSNLILINAQDVKLTQEGAPIKIGLGDLVDVVVYDNSDLSSKCRVSETGDITLPLIGIVHVAGLTVEEAGKSIEKRYIESRILKAPQVALFDEEYVKEKIVVSGEVKAPGLYPAYATRSINEVLTQAGGVTNFASSKVVVLRRGDPDHRVTVAYNPTTLSPVVPDVQISPGDTVVVPRAGVVYVVGGAQRPGAYILEGRDTLSLEKLVAYAGGGTPASRLDKSMLIRDDGNGTKIEAQVRLQQILNGKKPDVLVRDGDVLFIPTSGLKAFGQQAASTLIGSGVGLALYRIAN